MLLLELFPFVLLNLKESITVQHKDRSKRSNSILDIEELFQKFEYHSTESKQ